MGLVMSGQLSSPTCSGISKKPAHPPSPWSSPEFLFPPPWCAVMVVIVLNSLSFAAKCREVPDLALAFSTWLSETYKTGGEGGTMP